MTRTRPSLIVMASAAFLLVTIAGIEATRRLADDNWFFTLVAYGPRWLAAMPLLLLLPAALLAPSPARRRSLLLQLAAVPHLVLFNDIKPPWRPPLPEYAGPVLRVITYNAGGGRITAAALAGLVADNVADIASIQECGALDAKPFEERGYTLRCDFGACVATRLPIRSADIRSPASDFWVLGGSGVINRLELEWNGTRLSLVNQHLETLREALQSMRFGFWKRDWPGPRLMNQQNAERDLESHLARQWVDRSSLPTLVMGDFNMPVESAIYRRYWSGFGNALSDRGLGHNVTKVTSWFGIRIDHVLYDRHWRCRSARVIDHLGGDHRPVLVELEPAGPSGP